MKRTGKRLLFWILGAALLSILTLGMTVSAYAEDSAAGDSAYSFDYHLYDMTVPPGTMSGFDEFGEVTVSGPDMSQQMFDYTVENVVIEEQQKTDPESGDVFSLSRTEHGWHWQAENYGQAVFSLSIVNCDELVNRGLVPRNDTLTVTYTVNDDDVISEEEAEANPENDIRIWNTVIMKPGDIYDVSEAGWNTTVYIKEPGNFTLKGKSETVRVIVESGGANVYLADGLNINCTARSYDGTRTSPIWVKDVDGTISIISKENASSYLEGYMCPAIRKEGIKSKLVFDTENDDLPGTITAKAGKRSAAIGTVMHSEHNYDFMGNMEFNGGNIVAEATGETEAAIGGACCCYVQDITINDGDIKASAEGLGAVIGSGKDGVAQNIVINGGSVYAENTGKETGACIGSGAIDTITWSDYRPASANGIHINGGDVTAVNNGTGAAIGSGEGAGVIDLQITNGTVHATNKSYGGPGIGAGKEKTHYMICAVMITGGYIEAYGSAYAPGIGMPKCDGTHTTCDIAISGGTVIARAGNGNTEYDIGGPDPDTSKTIITGGSVYASGISGTVVNDNDDQVHCVEVTCTQIPEDSLYYLLKDLVCSDGYSYGMQQVTLVDIDKDQHTGKFYPWLPDTDEKLTNASLVTFDLSNKITEIHYSGDIAFKDDVGTMKPSPEALVQLLPDPVTLKDEKLVDYVINTYLALSDEEMSLISDAMIRKLAAAEDVISQGKAAAKATKVTSAKNKKGKKVLVKWKAAANVTGYKVSYSTSKNFKKGVKTKRMSAAAAKLTLKKLKKGKTYYIKVQPYTKVTNRITGKSKTIYGKAQNSRKVKIRK